MAIGQVADALESTCPNLARLLRAPTPSGPPLLAAAFAFFFRREVETNEELAHGLLFDNLQQLTASQARAFDEINGALSSLGPQFDAVFEQLGRIEAAVVQTQATAEATHGAVLDVQTLLQQLVELQLTQREEVRSLLLQVQDNQARARIHKGELRSQDSFSIRSEDERRAVKVLLCRFRQLPAEEQRQLPGLLNGLGKLQVGAGDFGVARQLFVEAAGNVPQADAKAEIYFNAFRASLEEKNWDEGLAALKQAASLDPGRFAPFNLNRYEPQCILGAGGFGTAFLCLDHNLGVQVVVKTLHTHDLERRLEEVFSEARLLWQLSHDSIIKVLNCEYADPAGKARPYLVMDYFPGNTLQQQVDLHGPLTLEAAVAVFRQIAEGMQAAHAQRIWHRDLKPANILVCQVGDRWQVKIIDFGLALRRQTVETSQAARSAGSSILGDSVAGTLKYAPPEQTGELRGVKPGPYSDVYAFARTCCYALFGQSELRRKHWESMPKELADLLEACLEPDPKGRPGSFQPVLAVLEQVAQTIDTDRQQRLRQEQEKAKERWKEGETRLTELILAALERTGGKPTAADTADARRLLTEYDLPKERASQLYQKIREKWRTEQEAKEEERKRREAAERERQHQAEEQRWQEERQRKEEEGHRRPRQAEEERSRQEERQRLEDERRERERRLDEDQNCEEADKRVFVERKLRPPAICLLVFGVLGLLYFSVLPLLAWRYPETLRKQIEVDFIYPVWFHFIIAGLCGVSAFAAINILRLRAYWIALTGSILAILLLYPAAFGVPVGIWCIVVLCKPEVRSSFR